MTVGDASDGVGDQGNDRANNVTDDDNMSDTADTTDANTFEIITHTQTSWLLDLDSTTPSPEQIPSADVEAEVESRLETPPNPVEAGSADTHRQVVVEHFTYGAPGAPINDMQGHSTFESGDAALGESVWAPFRSECDWRFAHWAKMNGPSSSALMDLLAIPNVRPPFFFLYCVAKYGLSL
jgi:hypothetical protein